MDINFSSQFFVWLFVSILSGSRVFGQTDLTLHALDSILKIKPGNTILSNEFVVAVDSISVANVRRLLIGDSCNYQKEVFSVQYKNKLFFGNEIVEILVSTDSVNRIQSVAYVIKINNASIIDSISTEFGSIQLFGSFGKKLLSNWDMVEQIYFWDYDTETNLMLIFYDIKQANAALPEVNSDVAVITVYRKRKRRV